MNVQELYQRYPKINQIISLGNENREHSPEVAQICDFIAGLVVDLIQYLPLPVTVNVTPPAPMPAPAPAWMPQSAPAPVDDRAEIRALLAALAAKL